LSPRALPVTEKQIETAKRTFKTLDAPLDPVVPVEIDYDTQVIEAGVLHIYPDVYGRGTNTTENLREEIDSSGINSSKLSNETLENAGAPEREGRVRRQRQSLEAGRALTDGSLQPIVGQATKKPTVKNALPHARGRLHKGTRRFLLRKLTIITIYCRLEIYILTEKSNMKKWL
jgi:hypothetical protein